MSDEEDAAAMRIDDGLRAVREALKDCDYEGAWRAVDAYRLPAVVIADLGLPPRSRSQYPRREKSGRRPNSEC